MKGFFNKILRINLSKQSFIYEDISDEILSTTLGGKGLGTYLMLKDNPQGVDPFAPENIFVIVAGPVTGTKLWSQSRFGVYSKSPATGGYGESYCGGTAAPKIKACGTDAIILEGKCKNLSFLVIDENGVTFNDASSIKGKDTFETEDYVLAHAPQGAGVLTIGPAGENLAAMACIKSDKWRSLGRGGMGAVWGSKNIKAIAFSGKRICPIADEDFLKQIIKNIRRKEENL